MNGRPDLLAQARQTFQLDRFQLDAIAELDRGRSVLVAAPTGSGKTIVAEAAIDMALHAGGRAFYTTPIKALSNQKFHDLVARLGPARVGLLTGDVSINGDGDVVVMTTEVLRNMMYGASTALERLHVVVLDEVHYLQDAYRGPVWEEVIIGLPPSVRLVCLSATVSNAEELGEWIQTVRGPTATIVETERPVDLHPLYLVGDRSSPEDRLVPIIVDGRPNPEARHFDADPRMARRRGPGGQRSRERYRTPRREEVVDRLASEDLLPAIYFIFSRAACDDAAARLRDANVRFTTPDERVAIRSIIERHTERLSDADLDALDYDLFSVAMEAGVAAHHAGMIPAFREAVEACFVRGLVKVVFATETLALGINMPARSVVIEKLTKYNGETHEFLTAGQFTQLTGRAGRRGIDEVGFAVVCWSPFVAFEQVAALASSRSFPLSSSFRPTYNMAVNLIRRYDRPDAVAMLGQSFAQYQADRAVVALARRVSEGQARLEQLSNLADDPTGEVARYRKLNADIARAEVSAAGRSRAAIDESLHLLRPGHLVVVAGPDGGDRRTAAVISVASRSKSNIRIRVVDRDGDVWMFGGADITEPIRPTGEVDLPAPYEPRSPVFLDAVAGAVALAAQTSPAPGSPAAPRRVLRLIAERDAMELHAAADRDVRLAATEEADRLRSEVDRLQRRLDRGRGSIVRRFELVHDLLSEMGAVSEWSLTSLGARLTHTYHECDLLLVMADTQGVFDALEPAELAATMSAVTYEERREGAAVSTAPSRRVGARLNQLESTWKVLATAEKRRGLPETKQPDRGFSAAAWGWASGAELADLLDEDLTGGDFVRNVKLLIDLLRQLGDHAHRAATSRSARAAADLLARGVVAASSDPSRGGEPVDGDAAPPPAEQ